jgi:probable HAF family extracellular repeat protein
MPAGFAAGYRLTDLGTLGGPGSQSYSINDQGDIAGVAEKSGGIEQAFLWTRAGGMAGLGTLGGAESAAFAVNNKGHVVGAAQTRSGDWQAFLWRPGSGMTGLGPPGSGWSQALDLNDRGDVLIRSLAPDGSIHALLWNSSDGFKDLGSLGGTETHGFALNNFGLAVGLGVTAAGRVLPFSWSQRGIQALPTPPGVARGSAWSVNDRGQIAGELDGTPSLYDNGQWQLIRPAIQTDPVPAKGCARGVNFKGAVVGYTEFPGFRGQSRAFLYSAGELRDLNDVLPANPDWQLLQVAASINRHGLIAGFGMKTPGVLQNLGGTRAFLAEPK